MVRQIKARAALKGTTMKEFFQQAVEDKLAADRRKSRKPSGWRAVFGKAPKGATAEVQAIIDEEFEKISPDEWK